MSVDDVTFTHKRKKKSGKHKATFQDDENVSTRGAELHTQYSSSRTGPHCTACIFSRTIECIDKEGNPTTDLQEARKM